MKTKKIHGNSGLTLSLLDLIEKVQAKQNGVCKSSRKRKLLPVQDRAKSVARRSLFPFFTDFNIQSGSGEIYDNKQRLELLRRIEGRQSPANDEEKSELVRFSGFGHMASIFDDKSPWRWQYRSLLNDKAQASAQASTPFSFFTPPWLVRSIWRIVKDLGFAGGNILEPALGIGHFIGGMPPDVYLNSDRVVGIELDRTSASIARILYPDVLIYNQGLEDTKFDDRLFDLVISNVPFGQAAVFDASFTKDEEKFMGSIHDYYFVKAIKLTRLGGLIAFLTSRYTLDRKDDTCRRYLARHADLVTAFRFANGTFAGTEAIADLLIFQRKEQADKNPCWTQTAEVNVAGHVFDVNKYFVMHPGHVVGDWDAKSGQFGLQLSVYTVTPKEDAIRILGEHICQPIYMGSEEEGRADRELAPEHTQDGEYYDVDGTLFFNEHGFAISQNKTKLSTDSALRQIEIARLARAVLDANLTSSEDGLREAQKALSDAYESFAREHGCLNHPENVKAFAGDIRAPLVRALEIYDSKTEKATRAAIFSRRTIARDDTPVAVQDTEQALSISLSRYGRVDLAYIGDLTGITEGAVLSALVGKIFLDPATNEWTTADLYLSGNIAEKARQAENASKTDVRYLPNLEALASVKPSPIPANEIIANLGATWIPLPIVLQFIEELLDPYSLVNHLGDPNWGYVYRQNAPTRSLQYVQALNKWLLEDRWENRTDMKTEKWGTKRANAISLLDDILNSRETTIYDQLRDGNKVLNQTETIAAREKAHAIKVAFREWLWVDVKRQEALGKIYNDTFNVYVAPKASGHHLDLPSASPNINLRPHQKNAIWRGINGENILFWHIVGAGKTYALVATAMEARRMGRKRKPLHVVPNHLLEQYSHDFLQLYPSAELLVIDSDGMSPQRLQATLARIATGDWDSVILTQSSFSRIPISEPLWSSFIDIEMDLIGDYIEDLKREQGYGDRNRTAIKNLERRRRTLEAQLKKRAEETKRRGLKGGLTWEQLGVDLLLVDEADMYRGLSFITNVNVPGINSAGSSMAYDMFVKSQWTTRRCTGGHLLGERKVCWCGSPRANGQLVFATGTALVNSICELYTMQKFLQLDTLLDLGLLHFDAWAKQFGDTETVIEMKPSGKGWRQNTRFVRFNNVPELWTAFAQNCDPQMDPAQLQLGRPSLATGQPIPVEIDPSPALLEYMDKCSSRAGKLDPRDPSADNILKIMSDAMKAAIDMRLVGYDIPFDPDGKIGKLVGNLYHIWREAKDDGEIRTQAVFLDVGTPGGSVFNLYSDIKQRLVERGVPREQIVFAHDGKTDAERKQIFDRVSSGDARIILGSTMKMGTGANMQKYLYALHEVDVPWTPRSVEQREGRILRQGNQHPEVYIYRYVTRQSMDFYRWHLITLKAGFIHQLTKGNVTERTVQDLESTVLSFAQMKAMATGDPVVLEQVKLEADLNKLHALYRKWEDDHQERLWRLRGLPDQIERARQSLLDYEDAANILSTAQNYFPLIVGGREVDDEKEANKIMGRYPDALRDGDEAHLHFGVVAVTIKCKRGIGEELSLVALCHIGGVQRVAPLVTAGHANIARIRDAISEIPGRVFWYRTELERLEDELSRLQQRQGDSEFPRMDEMIATRRRLQEIEKLLRAAAGASADDIAVDESVDESTGKQIFTIL